MKKLFIMASFVVIATSVQARVYQRTGPHSHGGPGGGLYMACRDDNGNTSSCSSCGLTQTPNPNDNGGNCTVSGRQAAPEPKKKVLIQK